MLSEFPAPPVDFFEVVEEKRVDCDAKHSHWLEEVRRLQGKIPNKENGAQEGDPSGAEAEPPRINDSMRGVRNARVFPMILPNLFGKRPKGDGLRAGATPSLRDVQPELAEVTRPTPVDAASAPSSDSEGPESPEKEPIEVWGDSLVAASCIRRIPVSSLYDTGSSTFIGPTRHQLAVAASRKLIFGSERPSSFCGRRDHKRPMRRSVH